MGIKEKQDKIDAKLLEVEELRTRATDWFGYIVNMVLSPVSMGMISKHDAGQLLIEHNFKFDRKRDALLNRKKELSDKMDLSVLKAKIVAGTELTEDEKVSLLELIDGSIDDE